MRKYIKRLVGASLISVGFGFAALAIGIPVALSMWLTHGSGVWITEAPSGAGEASVWLVSTAAGLLLIGIGASGFYRLVRLVVSRDDRRRAESRTRSAGIDAPVMRVTFTKPAAGAPLEVR